MRSGYIRARRLSTERRPGSAVIMPIIYMMVLLVCILVCFSYRMWLIRNSYERLENGLVQSLLAGSVVNLHKYARTGELLIEDDEPQAGDSHMYGSYGAFLACLKDNLSTDDSFNISSGHGVRGRIEVTDYRIYNYHSEGSDFYITETSVKKGITITHGKNEHVYVEANDSLIDIDNTSVYGEIRFDMMLSGYSRLMAGLSEKDMERTYVLKRLVSIKETGQ